MSIRAAARVLEQGTWGTTVTGIINLRSRGFNNWFAQQVAAPISAYPDQPLLYPDGTTNSDIQPLKIAFYKNALYGHDQLRQRVAFALSEIWVVSNSELNNAPAFPPLLRIFQKHAFGNYESLMMQVTLNPAMGCYLNMVDNNPGVPNQNYAREFMQLFTLGLQELNIDGTPRLDAGGNPIPAFNESTVAGLSKVFTGWTYAPMPATETAGHNPPYFLSPMVTVANGHDLSAKPLFDQVTLPENQSALQDLTAALHAVFEQPSIAPFVSKHLIQHLVTSNPSPAYIARVAGIFENDGNGVRGNLEALSARFSLIPKREPATIRRLLFHQTSVICVSRCSSSRICSAV